MAGQIYNPTNPDLSGFHAAGGKLIVFHGMSDNNIPVEASIDYYRKAQRANGDTTGYFRLFTPPGMNHCRDGDGGGDADWISAIENWVEHGTAPGQIVTYHVRAAYPTAPRGMEDYGAPYIKLTRYPIDPASYDRGPPGLPLAKIDPLPGQGRSGFAVKLGPGNTCTDFLITPRSNTMPDAAIRKAWQWSLPVVAVAAGWLGGRFSASDITPRAEAAAAVAPLTRLLIEDEIRQKIVLYGLYADGDGAGGRPRDLVKLARTLMTPDVVSEIHPANGGAAIIFNGRDVIAKAPPEVDPDRARRIAGRHYLINTVFDAVTPTTAETRTTAVYFDATRNPVGPKCHVVTDGECGGTPVKTIMWVYQMQWRKTSDGWQIARNTLRDDN
jgi:hypothetical protein